MAWTSLKARPNVYRAGISQGARKASGTSGPVTMFATLTGDSGNANLSDTLTVNSTAVAPTLAYRGEDANGTTWTPVAGPSLSIGSTGATPTSALTPVTTSTERAQAFVTTGKVYLSATNGDGNLGTDDFVIEMLYRAGSAGQLIGNRVALGWKMDQTSATAARLVFSDGTTNGTPGWTSNTGAWYHVLAFSDRSEGANSCSVFVNGQLIITTTTPTNSIDASNVFAIGAQPDANGKTDASLGFARMWRRPSWFAGTAGGNAAQWLAVAQERFARLTGCYASASTGGKPTPTTMTRTSIAYLDRVVSTGPSVRQLFLTGANWPRLCRRENVAGGTFLTGAVLEPQATNLCLQSETFDNASWTKVAGTITPNATAAPSLDATADAYVADATTGLHALAQTFTLTAATHVFSCFVKAGNQSMVILEDGFYSTTGRAWFNLATGAVGTVQSSIAEALIEPFGNGWFRCSIKFTGTAASHTLAVYCASTDSDPTSTGDASTTSTLVWGAQLEIVSDGAPSSYVTTTTASITRTIDSLDYDLTGSFPATGLPFTVSYDMMSRSYDLLASSMPLWISSASGTNTDSVYPVISGADVAAGNMFVGGVNQLGFSGGTDIMNGEKHTHALVIASNNAALVVDGSTVATDATVNLMSAAMTYARIGSFQSGTNMCGCLVSNVLVKTP